MLYLYKIDINYTLKYEKSINSNNRIILGNNCFISAFEWKIQMAYFK